MATIEEERLLMENERLRVLLSETKNEMSKYMHKIINTERELFAPIRTRESYYNKYKTEQERNISLAMENENLRTEKSLIHENITNKSFIERLKYLITKEMKL